MKMVEASATFEQMQDFEDQLKDPDALDDAKWESYLQDMSKDRVYGDYAMIKVRHIVHLRTFNISKSHKSNPEGLLLQVPRDNLCRQHRRLNDQ